MSRNKITEFSMIASVRRTDSQNFLTSYFEFFITFESSIFIVCKNFIEFNQLLEDILPKKNLMKKRNNKDVKMAII